MPGKNRVYAKPPRPTQRAKSAFAPGFGGNRTMFSLIAAEIIRDAVLDRLDPDAPLFRPPWRGGS